MLHTAVKIKLSFCSMFINFRTRADRSDLTKASFSCQRSAKKVCEKYVKQKYSRLDGSTSCFEGARYKLVSS